MIGKREELLLQIPVFAFRSVSLADDITGVGAIKSSYLLFRLEPLGEIPPEDIFCCLNVKRAM